MTDAVKCKWYDDERPTVRTWNSADLLPSVHEPSSPPAATEEDAICGAIAPYESDPEFGTGCALNRGHDGPHSDGDYSWKDESSRPETTTLPDLAIIDEDYDDRGTFVEIASYRAATRCRERQLLAALEELATLRRSHEALKKALENAKIKHIDCEDTWYSCPLSPEGCANDSAGDECNCGADRHNQAIDAALDEARKIG